MGIMPNCDVENVISLFHRQKPIKYTLKEIRLQADDSRWVIYVDLSDGKYVIKIASNNFTTAERVNAWADLIEEYGKMGYYSPCLLLSKNENYAECATFKGKKCIVWEEEFAKYNFICDLDKSAYTDKNNRYTYHDELLAFFGKVGEKHFKGFPGKSGWVRLEPFGRGDSVDEITECVQTFDALVKSDAPYYVKRWQEILRLWEQNHKILQEVYPLLPTSVFQGDWSESNLLLDDNGHFKGIIDYNLAGEDTVLNIFMSMIFFGLSYQRKKSSNPDDLLILNETTQNSVIEIMLETLRSFKKYYRFSETEVCAAPLLYKYIISIEYSEIEAFKQYSKNGKKLNQLFDFMENELKRDNIDFRSAML